MPEPVVSCRNAGILYHDDCEPHLNGILVDGLEIPSGGITAVLGPSGAGKSTLLSLFGGLKRANVVSAEPSGSRVDLAGEHLGVVQLLHGAVPPPGTLGYVFQESHLMKSLPVGLNLEMARSLTAGRLPENEFAEFMDSFGMVEAGKPVGIEALGRLRAKRVNELSGGQQQRIAVGRAVASHPSIIFCDEPTSSLDPHTARMVMNYLSDWTRHTDGTVLWVTHDQALVLKVADHVLYVRESRVISDHGLPFTLPCRNDPGARHRSLVTIRARAEWMSPPTAEELEETGLVLNPTDSEHVSAAGKQKRGGQGRAMSSAGILRFVWHFVIAEIFQRQPRSLDPDKGDARRVGSIFKGLTSFSKPTFAMVLLLGLLACYATFLGHRVLDAALSSRLALPEVAHFVMGTTGQARNGGRGLLSNGTLKDLSSNLAESFSSEIDAGATPPRAYGRRFDLFASVASADGDDCSSGASRDGSAALLVFQHAEPLYAQLNGAGPDGSFAIGELDRKDLRGAAFVTPTFLRRILRTAPDAQLPRGFCFGEVPMRFVRIAGLVENLPGSAELQYEFAMTNDAYLQLLKDDPPASWGGRFPPFQAAALYFDAAYAEELFCQFNPCAEAPGLYRPAFGASYKLDEDALEQVRRLVGIAVGGQGVLTGVLFALLATVAIAIALSVKAFIASNERFLCIMRAFGYRLHHVSLLFLLEFLLITFAAALPFTILIALFHVLAAPWLVEVFALEPAWLGATTLGFSTALGCGYGLVSVVGLAILAIWWKQNRYVGQKLQAL